jgi:hypothetical protein
VTQSEGNNSFPQSGDTLALSLVPEPTDQPERTGEGAGHCVSLWLSGPCGLWRKIWTLPLPTRDRGE